MTLLVNTTGKLISNNINMVMRQVSLVITQTLTILTFVRHRTHDILISQVGQQRTILLVVHAHCV
jgi:hypothetical protein